MKAHLIQAQSLEIMIDRLLAPVSMLSDAGEIAETMEEIANIYLNIAERISSFRADDSIFIPQAPERVPEENSMLALMLA